jgi:hypothetical protein
MRSSEQAQPEKSWTDMVVSNDVLDDQLQACSGSVDPTSESVL